MAGIVPLCICVLEDSMLCYFHTQLPVEKSGGMVLVEVCIKVNVEDFIMSETPPNSSHHRPLFFPERNQYVQCVTFSPAK